MDMDTPDAPRPDIPTQRYVEWCFRNLDKDGFVRAVRRAGLTPAEVDAALRPGTRRVVIACALGIVAMLVWAAYWSL